MRTIHVKRTWSLNDETNYTPLQLHSKFSQVTTVSILLLASVQRFTLAQPRAVTKMLGIRKTLEGVYESMTDIQADGESCGRYSAACFDCKPFEACTSWLDLLTILYIYIYIDNMYIYNV